jgi:gliding motility-associated-like protein
MVIVKEPRPDTVNVTNGICGDYNGSFKLGQVQNGTAPFMYSIAGQSNTTGNFTGLGAGTYTYKVTDAMGCIFSDSVNITESNLVKAGYITQKFNDEPLKIGFINNSSNATHYIWIMPGGDTLYSDNFTQLFDSGGTYQVMLIAYNNYPHCADTVMHTIDVDHHLLVLAPNVFTPNEDGVNDAFTIDVKGASNYSVSIFNRWGNQVYNWQKANPIPWNGRTPSGQECSEGVYYYTITGILENGAAFQKQGTVHLLR